MYTCFVHHQLLTIKVIKHYTIANEESLRTYGELQGKSRDLFGIILVKFALRLVESIWYFLPHRIYARKELFE